MRLVIFGLTVSSSWGNGHATIWRGLCRALARQGHQVSFFERDVPYYATHRDLQDTDGYQLILYSVWEEVEAQAREAVAAADSAIVTSYCPDALAATELASSALAVLKYMPRNITPPSILPAAFERIGPTIAPNSPDGLQALLVAVEAAIIGRPVVKGSPGRGSGRGPGRVDEKEQSEDADQRFHWVFPRVLGLPHAGELSPQYELFIALREGFLPFSSCFVHWLPVGCPSSRI